MGTRKLAAGGFVAGALCAALFVGGGPILAQDQDEEHEKCACTCVVHESQAADRYTVQLKSAGKLVVLDGATGTVYAVDGTAVRTIDPVAGTLTVGTLQEIDERGLIKPAPAVRKRTVR